MVVDVQSIEPEIRRILSEHADALRGYRVYLFGSRSRGTERAHSDFDVGVWGAHPMNLETFFKIGDAFETLPTLYRIDWVDLNRAGSRLRQNALNEGQLLYEG